jgi:hypothetical protein
MDTRARHRTLTAALLLLAVLATGCSDTGLYAEAKNDWDSPRGDQQQQDLRLRLATTQQDH